MKRLSKVTAAVANPVKELQKQGYEIRNKYPWIRDFNLSSWSPYKGDDDWIYRKRTELVNAEGRYKSAYQYGYLKKDAWLDKYGYYKKSDKITDSMITQISYEESREAIDQARDAYDAAEIAKCQERFDTVDLDRFASMKEFNNWLTSVQTYPSFDYILYNDSYYKERREDSGVISEEQAAELTAKMEADFKSRDWSVVVELTDNYVKGHPRERTHFDKKNIDREWAFDTAESSNDVMYRYTNSANAWHYRALRTPEAEKLVAKRVAEEDALLGVTREPEVVEEPVEVVEDVADDASVDISAYKPSQQIIDKIKDYKSRNSMVNTKAIRNLDKLYTYYYTAKLLGWAALARNLRDAGELNFQGVYDPDIFDAMDDQVTQVGASTKITKKKQIIAARDWYFGKDEADQFGDLIVKKLAGKTISKRKDKAEEPGGLIFEADRIGIDMWDLLRALEGMCDDGRAREIDDSTYKVFADVEGTKDIVCSEAEDNADKVEYLLREAAKMLGYRIQEWTTKNDPYGPTETAYLLIDENGDTVGMLQETYETDVLGILYDCFNNVQRAKKRVAEYLQNETQRFDDAFNSPTL